MSKYEVCNLISGHSFGLYEADSEEAAIETVCKEAGYDSKAHAQKSMGCECELVAYLQKDETDYLLATAANRQRLMGAV